MYVKDMVLILIRTVKSYQINRRILYWYDGIHLTDIGTSKLLKIYDNVVPVIKRNTNNQDKCYNCGERGHNAERCRHKQKISCYICGYYGHKAKHCRFH